MNQNPPNKGPRKSQRRVPLLAMGKKGWEITAGVAVLVGLVGGVIQLADYWSTKSSAIGTVKLDGFTSSTGRILASYAVPVNAPFHSFPTNFSPDGSGSYLCSPEQSAWLSRHGREYRDLVTIRAWNRANAGGSVSVVEFRTEGRLKGPDTPSIAVYCMKPAHATVPADMGYLLADNESAAVYESQESLGLPVTFSLEPGSAAETVLLIQAPQDFWGRITVKVLAGDEEMNYVIRVDDKDELFIPSFFATRDLHVELGGIQDEHGLICVEYPSNEEVKLPCTPDELQQKVEGVASGGAAQSLRDLGNGSLRYSRRLG
jgi:hypothetical protein